MRKFPKNPMKLRNELVAASVDVTGNISEVARHFDLSRQTVRSIVNKVKEDALEVDDYISRRGEISAWNQLKRQEKQVDILNTIKLLDIEKADLKTKMLMLNTLGLDKSREFEMERLEKGESTENVAVIVGAIKDLKRRRELEEENPTGTNTG